MLSAIIVVSAKYLQTSKCRDYLHNFINIFHILFSLQLNRVVIHAWVNSNEKDAIQRAHKILSEMQSLRKSGERPDLVPDAVSFTSIVSTLAKDSVRGKTKERMLDTMMSILKDDDGQEIKLDSVAYNALIHAQGSADKAEMLLDFMLEQGSNSTIRPVSN